MVKRLDYTSALETAWNKAGRWATAAGAGEISVRHLFQGLIHEEGGRPALLLEKAGANLAAVRGDLPELSAADCQPGAAVRDLLHEAADIALHLSAEGTIATEHVLLAILRVDKGLRSNLEALGLDFQRLEHSVLGPQTPLQLDEPLDLSEPREQLDLARILDASANRAREALP